jgi:hypothetical protein
MLRSRKANLEYAAAIDQVRGWTRARFSLPEHAVIMVSEVSCALPGCPPIETIVVFWTDDAVRHRFKLFKPVAEVIANDLPSSFMKRALADTAEIGLECC